MAQPVIPESLLPADPRFGCGPSKVRAGQLQFLNELSVAGVPVLGTSHRQDPVKNLVGGVREGLAQLLRAPAGYEVVLGLGGATSFWDAAAFSLIERRSQHLVFGEFGGKFARVVAGAPWLEEPDVREVAAGGLSCLVGRPGVDVYAYPHNETSTGVMAPVVRACGDGVDEGALTVVDATSAAGGLDFDAAACDVYYFSPQKNFGADGGLWFALFSPAAVERVARVCAGGRYVPETLNLALAVENSRKNQTLNTPAVATLALVAAQVDWLNGCGGLGWAAARTAQTSGILYDWVARTDCATAFVENVGWRSSVVVTIDFSPEVDAASLCARLRAAGVVDVEPYRKLGRNQLRVACFVNIEPDDARALTACLDFLLENV